MNLIDIIHIHDIVVKQFESLGENAEALRVQADEIQTRLDSHDNLSEKTRQSLIERKAAIEQEIKAHEDSPAYHYYLFHAIPLIEQYKELVQTPMRLSFMKSHRLQYQKDSNHTKKKDIVMQYLELVKKHKLNLNSDVIPEVYLKDFTNIEDDAVTASSCTCTDTSTDLCDFCAVAAIRCTHCNMADFDVDGNLFTCTHCGLLLDLINASSCIKDIDRVNISSKYTYDRRSHFKECIDQYQAKESQHVPDKVFEDLLEQIRIHGLEDAGSGGNRYARVDKQHIQMFLKELNYTKYYENLIFIYHKITGKPPENISGIESKLMEDFDTLIEHYDKKCKTSSTVNRRKNFINIQCILYQLLMKHGHKCKRSDFNIMKTVDKKYVHEDMVSDLFRDLGWKFHRI